MRHTDIVAMIKSIARQRLIEADDVNDQVSTASANKKKKVVIAKKDDIDKKPSKIVINPVLYNNIDQRR